MDIQQVIIKLKALRGRCDKLMQFYSSLVPKVDVDNIFKQFVPLREQLHKEMSNLFDGFELQDYTKHTSTIGPDSYQKFAVRAIKDDISYYLEMLEGLETISVPNLKVTNEGIYFSGQYFEALSKLTDIFKTAKSEVILVDGYVDEKVLNLFTALEGKVKIKILTKGKSLTPSLKTLAEQFNKQFSNSLEIKVSEAFHDRFLIIDQHELFHIGASMKDAGNRGFMFSRIEEPFIQKQLMEEFNKHWK